MAQNGRRRDQRQPGASENSKYISSYNPRKHGIIFTNVPVKHGFEMLD